MTGDFNVKKKKKKKRKEEEEEDFKSMGAFGTGEKSERRYHIIKFAEEDKLIIANSFGSQKNRYWTWESPDEETRTQIDFTLSNQSDHKGQHWE